MKGNLGQVIDNFRQISYLNLEHNGLTEKDVQLLMPLFKLRGLDLGTVDETQP